MNATSRKPLLIWLALIVLIIVFGLTCLIFLAADAVPHSIGVLSLSLLLIRIAMVALYGFSIIFIAKAVSIGRLLGAISFGLMTVSSTFGLFFVIGTTQEFRYMTRLQSETLIGCEIAISAFLLLSFLFSKQIERYFQRPLPLEDGPLTNPSPTRPRDLPNE